MRNGRAGAYEFTVRLEDPNELFEPRGSDVLAGRPPQDPAIEQIHDELHSHPRDLPAAVAIVLPPDKATPDVERGVEEAVARYCATEITRTERELEAIRRDGLQTLLFGAVVLAVGLVLSEAVLRTRGWPKELRDFLGNGLFLVVAWVGLWYPLDTLFYSGRPYRAELKALRSMARLRFVVRPASGDRPHPAPAVEPAPQSLTGG
jgi:hypothetical protein